MKHISELKPAQKAMADQSFRDALLAIVVSQGKAVTIPIAVLNEISEKHRLILEVDREAGVVILTPEKIDGLVLPATFDELEQQTKPSN